MFKKERISFIREKTYKDLKNGAFRFDFYLTKQNVLVEIDGEQHYQEKSIERDEKRTQNLSSKGWELIMRIRWAEWKTYSEIEKKRVIEIIKDSLK